jgi:hypothetical protein
MWQTKSKTRKTILFQAVLPQFFEEDANDKNSDVIRTTIHLGRSPCGSLWISTKIF